MKKIWLVGIAKDFRLIEDVATKLHTKYQPYSVEPIKEINPEDVESDYSLWLFGYVPDNFMDNVKGFSTFQILYTDNEEKVRHDWYVGIIAHYNHLKSLEKSRMLRLDKRTTKPMKRIIEEANKHREDFPELWL